MKLSVWSVGGLWAAWCVAGCAPPPVYDDDIGVQAIPAAVGSLAGTFALKTINQTLVNIPVLGDRAGGGANFRLVTRTYDEAAGVYQQQSTLCDGFNFEVAGVTSTIPRETYRAVPASTAEIISVNHDEGTYESTGHLQLWALRDLPEPATTALPANADEAAQSPHVDRIYDMDGDNRAGITIVVSGAVQGELYVVQRKTVTLRGVILGADTAVGLATNTNEVVTLGNNNALLDRQREGSAAPHPNPRRSYFHEVRLEDGATCDDLDAAREDGRLPVSAPFPAE
jgi:hypothetical protein